MPTPPPQYNVTFDVAPPRGRGARTLDQTLADLVDSFGPMFHPAAYRSPIPGRARARVVITMPAADLHAAIELAASLARTHIAGRVLSVEIIETADFDARLKHDRIPDLVGITEAATILGTSRQAVQQRIDAGSLPAVRVGKQWIMARSAVLPPA